MIKKSIILLVLALFLSGCVERGQTVYPSTSTYSHEKEHNKVNDVQYKVNDVQPAYVLRITAKDRKIDPVKNTISGALMLIIGLMIIL